MPSFFLLFLETDVLYCVIAPRELYRDIKQETSSACPALFFCEETIRAMPCDCRLCCMRGVLTKTVHF